MQESIELVSDNDLKEEMVDLKSDYFKSKKEESKE
jgi:hypothetical protein